MEGIIGMLVFIIGGALLLWGAAYLGFILLGCIFASFGSGGSDSSRDDGESMKEYIATFETQVGKICEKLEDSDSAFNQYEVDKLKGTYDTIVALCLKHSGGWELKQHIDKVFHPAYEEASKRLSRQECETQQRQKWVNESDKREFYKQKKRASERKLDANNRLKIERQHGKLLDSVTELMSSSVSPYTETMRGAVALGGAEFVSPEKMVLWDVKQLLIKLSLASSVPSNDISVGGVSVSKAVALGRLFHGIRVRVEPSTECTLSESQAALVLGGEHLDLELPGMVRTLALYDTVEGTQLASKAALTYRSIAVTAANLCGNSFGVKLVTNAYLELLKPYIPKSSDDGRAGYSNYSSKCKDNARCEKCVKNYQILDLPFGAADDEVKSKRRAFAEFLHPDQLGSKSEQARHAAEQQLMNINEACDHILQCRISRSSSQSAGV